MFDDLHAKWTMSGMGAMQRLFHLSKTGNADKNTPTVLVRCNRAGCYILAGDLNFRVFSARDMPDE